MNEYIKSMHVLPGALAAMADAIGVLSTFLDQAMREVVRVMDADPDWATLRIETRLERDVLGDGPQELVIDVRCRSRA